jgi:hypothetical protein
MEDHASGRKVLNIVGKDWLTVTEAAHYCGVSERQFRENAPGYGLVARRFMGKQLYETAALYRAIYDSPAWDGSFVPPIALERRSLGHTPDLHPAPLRPIKRRK